MGDNRDQTTPAIGPQGDAFFEPPKALTNYELGELIWYCPLETNVPGAQAWRILYRSVDVAGRATAASGMVVAPDGATDEPRPVISFGHGSVGLSRSATPSLCPDPTRDFVPGTSPAAEVFIDHGIIAVNEFIAAGYVVAATDYQGMATAGTHQYLVGVTNGADVLAAAAACQQIPQADAGQRTIGFGWSQGGQAVLCAAEHPEIVPDRVELVGVCALAPSNTTAILLYLEQAGLPKPHGDGPSPEPGRYLMVTAGSCAAYPDLALEDALTPAGIEFARIALPRQVLKHLSDSAVATAARKRPTTSTDRVPLGPLTWDEQRNYDRWQARHAESSPAATGRIPNVPVSIYHGEDDVAVPVALSKWYVEQVATQGFTAELTTYPDTSHHGLPYAAKTDYLDWCARRFSA